MTDPDSKYPDFAARFIEATMFVGMEKLSQTELGKKLKVSGPTVNNYRKGRKLPAMETAIRICELTGAELQWLMTGKGPRKNGGAASLQESWDAAPREVQLAFLEMIVFKNSQ